MAISSFSAPVTFSPRFDTTYLDTSSDEWWTRRRSRKNCFWPVSPDCQAKGKNKLHLFCLLNGSKRLSETWYMTKWRLFEEIYLWHVFSSWPSPEAEIRHHFLLSYIRSGNGSAIAFKVVSKRANFEIQVPYYNLVFID